MATDHLLDEDLARLALTGGADPHVAACPQCSEGLQAFELLMGRLRALPDPPESLLAASVEFYRRRRLLEALLERLTEDVALRERARLRPEAVLRDAGLEPLPELVDLLREDQRAGGEAARRLAAKRLWF